MTFLILIALTLGMVNASEDVSSDNLTDTDAEILIENSQDLKQSNADSSDILSSNDEKNDLKMVEDDTIYLNDDDMGNFEIPRIVTMDKDFNTNVVSISFYNKKTGDFKVFVDDNLRYSHKIVSSDYKSNWLGLRISPQQLKMDSYGTYNVKVSFNDKILGERNVQVRYTLDLLATSKSHDWEFEDDTTLYFKWGEKIHFYVALPSDAKDGTLTLTIDSKNYNLKIGETLRIDTSNWKIGKHKVIAKYAGDSKYSVEQTGELVVCINPIITYPEDYRYGDDGTISIKAPKGTNGVAKLYIEKDDSKKLVGSFEIKNGVGKYKLTDLTKKEYWYWLDYSFGDYNHSVSLLMLMKKPKKKLVLKSVKVKKSSKKLTLKASLKFDNRPAKNIKLKFKFNKIKFKAKTNKKGVAKVTIPKSVIKKLKVGSKITYKVSYGKTTVKKSAWVKR